MSVLDKRFALLRDGHHWYPARLRAQTAGMEPTFRIISSGTDYADAEQTVDIERVVRAVIRGGMRAQFAPEGGYGVFLSLRSARVTGWRLEPQLARKLRLEPAKDFGADSGL